MVLCFSVLGNQYTHLMDLAGRQNLISLCGCQTWPWNCCPGPPASRSWFHQLHTAFQTLHLVLVGQGRGALGHVPWLAVVWQQDGVLQAASRVWQCRWVPAAGFVLGVAAEFQAWISRPPRNPELLSTFL